MDSFSLLGLFLFFLLPIIIYLVIFINSLRKRINEDGIKSYIDNNKSKISIAFVVIILIIITLYNTEIGFTISISSIFIIFVVWLISEIRIYRKYESNPTRWLLLIFYPIFISFAACYNDYFFTIKEIVETTDSFSISGIMAYLSMATLRLILKWMALLFFSTIITYVGWRILKSLQINIVLDFDAAVYIVLFIISLNGLIISYIKGISYLSFLI